MVCVKSDFLEQTRLPIQVPSMRCSWGVPCGGSRNRQEGGGGGEQGQDQTKPPGQFPPDASGNLTQGARLS